MIVSVCNEKGGSGKSTLAITSQETSYVKNKFKIHL